MRLRCFSFLILIFSILLWLPITVQAQSTIAANSGIAVVVTTRCEWGSGFYVGRLWHGQQLIMTAYHLIAGRDTESQARCDSYIEADGVRARIVAIDTQHDLLLLAINSHRHIPHLVLRPVSDSMFSDEPVYLVGNPKIYMPPFVRDYIYLTTIIVHAKMFYHIDEEVILYTFKLPGVSGSPVFSDLDGSLIGIITHEPPCCDNTSFGVVVPAAFIEQFINRALTSQPHKR